MDADKTIEAPKPEVWVSQTFFPSPKEAISLTELVEIAYLAKFIPRQDVQEYIIYALNYTAKIMQSKLVKQ